MYASVPVSSRIRSKEKGFLNSAFSWRLMLGGIRVTSVLIRVRIRLWVGQRGSSMSEKRMRQSGTVLQLPLVLLDISILYHCFLVEGLLKHRLWGPTPEFLFH